MALLKQSTTYTRMFLMVQSADHISGLTGAAPTVNISKAGAAFGAAGGVVTEVANGFYKVALTTTDTNTLGDLAYHITAASGDATDFVDQITAAVDQTGDSFVRLGAPAGASVSADIAAIKSDTGTILTDVNTGAGAIYTRIGAPAGASIAADIAAVEANAVAIKAKTDTIPTFPTNFGLLAIDSGGNVSTTDNIKKNTAQTGFMFVMTDSTSHNPKTGLIVTAQRALDGNGFNPCTNTPSEVGNGVYAINLSAADTNANHIMLRFTAAASDDLNIEIVTQP